MNKKLFKVKLYKFHQIGPNIRYDRVYALASTTYRLYSQKNDILCSWLNACFKLANNFS